MLAALPSPSLVPAPRDWAVEVVDLSRRYGGRWALARLSFQLPAGSSLLLTGHNGSGKTTLLKVLATMLAPSAGTARVLGLDIKADARALRSQVALLSHANHLYEDLSARENLIVLARLLGRPNPADEVGALLEEVGLGARADHPVRQFSAGMRRRVGVARLLLKAPRLALLDEPFGELDPAGIDQMEKIIHALKARGTTLILATHLIDQGRALCDARLHLHEGRGVEVRG